MRWPSLPSNALAAPALLREERRNGVIGHLAMMHVTEPIHRGLGCQVGYGLRQPWGHKQLALLGGLPTD